MTTLTVQIPDKKADLAKQILEELGAKIIIDAEKVPNDETKKAMMELKAGKGKRFKSVDELFASIK